MARPSFPSPEIETRNRYKVSAHVKDFLQSDVRQVYSLAKRLTDTNLEKLDRAGSRYLTARIVALRLVSQALDGNLAAIEKVVERSEGKPQQTIVQVGEVSHVHRLETARERILRRVKRGVRRTEAIEGSRDRVLALESGDDSLTVDAEIDETSENDRPSKNTPKTRHTTEQ